MKKYEVASISRIDQIKGLFCKRDLQKRLHSAKETYNFIDPTNRSHPIAGSLTFQTIFAMSTLSATHCNTLQHTATHCNTLQLNTHLTDEIAANFIDFLSSARNHSVYEKERDGEEVFFSANANQISASAHVFVCVYVCTTLQHTATHCNTLQAGFKRSM